MAATNLQGLKALRAAFPKGTVGQLPKPYKKDSPKGDCKDCGKYHGLPAVHLDYVGHAAVTDRLLEVDPEWSWEPMATDEHGLPKADRAGNLWIKLTVLGTTRIGVGDGNNAKEIVGDALRNAAMRFGVALDLWSKEELESILLEPDLKNDKATDETPAKAARQPAPVQGAPVFTPLEAAKFRINEGLEALSIKAVAAKKAYIASIIGQSNIETIEQANDVEEALRIATEDE